jgi:hypothetical protein
MATFMDTSDMDAALMQFSDSLVPTDEFIDPAKEMITKVHKEMIYYMCILLIFPSMIYCKSLTEGLK